MENLLRKNFVSNSDQFYEEFFLKSTSRNESGQYIVSLPFKEAFPRDLALGNSRSSAFAQFIRNENRLKKNPSFHEEYNQVLQEYLDLGHMSEISSTTSQNSDLQYYLPHHAVIKAESTTTKVRVVFNASSASSNGNSLNDVLYTGPALQNDLILPLHR